MDGVYEMAGRVKVVFGPMTFASGFTKREFVLTTEDNYPQDVKFVCVKERTALLDGLQPGERVSVAFRICGNEYKERYFVDLQAFRIEPLEGAAGVQPAAADQPDDNPFNDQF
jgi:single-strand DNA-binding protein